MPVPASADATADKFSALVELGDKARAERRLGDAVAAYIDALYLKDDPTVHGRVGLIAQAIRTPDHAANHLLEAVTRDGGETAAERAAFLAAYGAVRPKVCRVSMYVPVVDADILVTLPGTQNCNIMNDATCKLERGDYALCLWTYECAYDDCADVTPTDGGTDGGLRCGCGKTCETVTYVERCTWNGTAFDCNCEKGGASVGTCQIEGQPTCDALDRYNYCCDPIFGL